ncbi:hypothetical protein TNCV_1667531 [Trichonephila clavipes]|nr:hypothetical protein TNCV_1667531 [Trichonephila clavipes]
MLRSLGKECYGDLRKLVYSGLSRDVNVSGRAEKVSNALEKSADFSDNIDKVPKKRLQTTTWTKTTILSCSSYAPETSDDFLNWHVGFQSRRFQSKEEFRSASQAELKDSVKKEFPMTFTRDGKSVFLPKGLISKENVF